MPLTVRRRGEVWHARGTIRVGRESIIIREFSTGCNSRIDAEAVASAEEARIRSERLAGPAGRQASLTIDDCLATYLRRPGGVKFYDADRIREFSDLIGPLPLKDAAAAWKEFMEKRGTRMGPATSARWQTVLAAALKHGCETLEAGAPPKLPKIKQSTNVRLIYLTDVERERLLASYSRNAAPVMIMLAYQGMRTQEALRLDWRYVSLRQGSLRIVESKTGRGRTLPIHPRVQACLIELWEKRQQPDTGPVFLSLRGEAYSDTRGQGGNPLTKAHKTACKKAGVEGFRVHDWRHDWAARCVMGGMDLRTLQRLGGWTTLRMVERYADVNADHMRVALAKLA